MKIFILMILFTITGCSAFHTASWTDRKRECHSFYMDRFGVNHEGAVKLCKEELGRQQ